MKTLISARTILAATAVLLLVMAPTGCKKEVKLVDINGIEKVILLVNDIKTGEPVADATVQILEYQLTTDAEGKVLFEMPAENAPADIRLVVRKNGYSSAGHNLRLEYLQNYRTLTMYLKPVESHDFISSAGGSVKDEGNNQVIIPNGALASAAEIFVHVQPYTSLPVSPGFFPVISFEIQSSGAELKKPVEVRLAIADGDEFEPGQEVPLWYFDDETLEWIDSGKKLSAGPDGSYLTAKVDQMKTYAAGKWYDWELITTNLVVNEISRSTIISTRICRYLYWKDHPTDTDLGKGNNKFVDGCSTGTFMGGHSDHVYDVALSPVPPTIGKVPGLQSILNAAANMVKNQLNTLLPAPGNNYRLKIGYHICLDQCYCREVAVDQYRNLISYATLPILRIQVNGTWYEVPFLKA
ncbi:MAG: hypothetical protein R6V75_01925, partial [Bacteroidales bacterium]